MKKNTSSDPAEYKWEVTNEAIDKLKELGIKVFDPFLGFYAPP